MGLGVGGLAAGGGGAAGGRGEPAADAGAVQVREMAVPWGRGGLISQGSIMADSWLNHGLMSHIGSPHRALITPRNDSSRGGSAGQPRVRVEITGPRNYEHVGKSQPNLNDDRSHDLHPCVIHH
eukprot:COSAG01_NODE_25085_length_756_cov_1.392694_2_plen_123_part_01